MNRLSATLLVFLSMSVMAVDPADFARAWTLNAEAEAGVARVRLPPEIQTTLTDPWLADLVITDANDQAVPFAILEASDLQEPLSRREILQYSESTATDATGSRAPGSSPLRLELLDDGRRMVLTMPRGQPDAQTQRPPVLEALIGAAEMPDELPDRRLTVRLQSLQAVDLDCRIRDADRPDERERRIRLADLGERHPYRYTSTLPVHQLPRAWHLRCFADRVPEGLRLEQALLVGRGVRDHRRLHRFQPGLEGDGAELDMALPGAYRVRHLAVTTRQDNVLADVVVRARNESDQSWRRLADGVLSTLPGEEPGANRMEIAHSTRYRHWQLQVDPAPGQGVEVDFSAEVDELVFLPQGHGPWRLYAGSRRVAPMSAGREMIERTAQRLGPAWQWPQAEVTGSVEAGGESALQVPPDPLPWQQILLWVVLGLAAAVLAAISLRLLRQDR